ncbi:MAG TPA: DUF2252 family protein [Kofleriaceae bacterium]|nr:DUF2252 family protein [Kofleriaceae bacterium]
MVSAPRPSVARCAALALALAGCSRPADDARTAFLVDAITADNLVWLAREPDALAGKYRTMATREFDFFRGTAAIYWRDATEGGPVPAGTAFGDDASAWLWLVGDPHLENLGTFRGADGVIALDWNDLDAATVGPWWLDLRRLAVGLAIASDELALGDGGDRVLVEAAVRAYVEEIERIDAGGARRLEGAEAGDAVAKLIDQAAREGADETMLATYTRLDGGRRTMFLGDVEPPRADGVWLDTTVAASAGENAAVRAAIASWRPTALAGLSIDEAAVKGVSRRLGAGVASYPVPRYYALLEGPTTGTGDDVLVELKEATDPPPLAASVPPGLLVFASAAERVVSGQRTLGARVDDDPYLGHGEVAPISYRVRERTGYQRGLDLADVAHDRSAAVALATTAGRLLASAHAFAPVPGDRGGARCIDRIAPRVRGRADELVDETRAFALAYADVVRADAARFAAALAERGPWLGAEPGR